MKRGDMEDSTNEMKKTTKLGKTRLNLIKSKMGFSGNKGRNLKPPTFSAGRPRGCGRVRNLPDVVNWVRKQKKKPTKTNKNQTKTR